MKIIAFNLWDNYPDDNNTGENQNTELTCYNLLVSNRYVKYGGKTKKLEPITIEIRLEILTYMKGIIDSFLKQINSKAHTALILNRYLLFYNLTHADRLKIVELFKYNFKLKDYNIIVFSES